MTLLTTYIGYAQTFEEAYERGDKLYQEETMGVDHVNPPVEDFLIWRDLRVFDGKLDSSSRFPSSILIFSMISNVLESAIPLFEKNQHRTCHFLKNVCCLA